MRKAQNLAQVIQYFNPMLPLKGETLQEWYIERPGNPLDEMKIYLQGLALNGTPVKLLFTGHAGSGKSTVLNKLAEMLQQQFLIVPLEVRQSLNIADLSYVDLVLGMAMALFDRASRPEILGQAPAQVILDYWEIITGFVEREIFGPAYLPPSHPKSEATMKINVLAAEFQAKFAAEAATREAIRQRMEPRLAEIHAKIDEVADLVQLHYRRPVLFLVEGTDKTDLSRARDIFLNHTYSLTAFRASVIYTCPISLRYSNSFTLLRDSFNETRVLPNVKVADRNGIPHLPGLELLERVLLARLDEKLVETEACQALVRASGGLLRTLIRLTQRAAVNALAGGGQVISQANVQAAINEERADYVAGLKEEDYPVLLARYRDKQLTADEPVLRLLETRALLEYTNADPWCDVHPVALPLVQQRTGVGEE